MAHDDDFDGAFDAARAQLRVVEGGRGRGRKGDGPPPVPPAPPPVADWDDAPFECLGVHGESWWFVDAYRQVVGLPAGRLCQRGPLHVLLAGDATGWAERHFPEFDREGQRTGDFSPRRLHKAIAARMLALPAFDPGLPRRGPGVWAEDGAPVPHCGDRVLLPEGERRPSFVRRGVAWVSGPRVAAPHDGAQGRPPPPDGLLAEEVEDRFRQWNWERPNSERMLLGWVTVANLGALPSFRPLCLVDGQEGAGKTTLLDVIASLSPAAKKTNDTTEAGLRQRLQARAAPVVLDEFEGERLEAVLGLLRRIVTGDGARSFRGTGDQRAIATEVVGTAIMGAIGAPAANAAEQTRILNLMLWPRAAGVAPLDRVELLAWAAEAGPRLWGRAIAAWPRIRENLRVVRAALDGAGCSPRYMDLIGWLVAAREAMVAERPLTEAEAAEALEWAAPWIVSEAEQSQDTTAARCLRHLMSHQVALAPGDSPTVASLIDRALRDEDLDSFAARTLLDIGLRLAPHPIADRGIPGLYVAAGRRPGLLRVFQGTEWAGGRWGTVLAQLRALTAGGEVRAVRVTGRVRFRGENDRAQAVWLHPSLLPASAPREEGMD